MVLLNLSKEIEEEEEEHFITLSKDNIKITLKYLLNMHEKLSKYCKIEQYIRRSIHYDGK